MKRNSPHTNKKNKPSTTKNPAQPDSVSQTTCSCKIYVWHLKFCTFVDKMLEMSMWALWKALWILSSKKVQGTKMCVFACTSVLLHKHAWCYSTFVSGTDFSLAFGLLLRHTNNNLRVYANILCCFISSFVLWVLSEPMYCIVVHYVPFTWMLK